MSKLKIQPDSTLLANAINILISFIFHTINVKSKYKKHVFNIDNRPLLTKLPPEMGWKKQLYEQK